MGMDIIIRQMAVFKLLVHRGALEDEECDETIIQVLMYSYSYLPYNCNTISECRLSDDETDGNCGVQSRKGFQSGALELSVGSSTGRVLITFIRTTALSLK